MTAGVGDRSGRSRDLWPVLRAVRGTRLWSASRMDVHSAEQRVQTIGRPSAGSPVTILVVHTEPVLLAEGDEQGRIISARVATPHERRAYEEGKF